MSTHTNRDFKADYYQLLRLVEQMTDEAVASQAEVKKLQSALMSVEIELDGACQEIEALEARNAQLEEDARIVAGRLYASTVIVSDFPDAYLMDLRSED